MPIFNQLNSVLRLYYNTVEFTSLVFLYITITISYYLQETELEIFKLFFKKTTEHFAKRSCVMTLSVFTLDLNKAMYERSYKNTDMRRRLSKQSGGVGEGGSSVTTETIQKLRKKEMRTVELI